MKNSHHNHPHHHTNILHTGLLDCCYNENLQNNFHYRLDFIPSLLISLSSWYHIVLLGECLVLSLDSCHNRSITLAVESLVVNEEGK